MVGPNSSTCHQSRYQSILGVGGLCRRPVELRITTHTDQFDIGHKAGLMPYITPTKSAHTMANARGHTRVVSEHTRWSSNYASPGILGYVRVTNPSNMSTHFARNSLLEYSFCTTYVNLVGQVGQENTVTAHQVRYTPPNAPLSATSTQSSLP